ncbi:MAG: hypothetical protein AB7I79_02055 [Rhizobiaceae bacterium]
MIEHKSHFKEIAAAEYDSDRVATTGPTLADGTSSMTVFDAIPDVRALSMSS